MIRGDIVNDDYMKKYYQKNKEKLNKRSNQYYQDNKERLKEKARKYGIENYEKISENKKEYYANKKGWKLSFYLVIVLTY